MTKEIGTEAVLENCRALINQIDAGLSAEEPFMNVSSAAELLLYLEFAASALQRDATNSGPHPHADVALRRRFAINYRWR
jgi:hypothetical protein